MSSERIILPSEVRVRLVKELRLFLMRRQYLERQLMLSQLHETKIQMKDIDSELLRYENDLENLSGFLGMLEERLSYRQCCNRLVTRWLESMETDPPTNDEQIQRNVKRAKRMLNNMSPAGNLQPQENCHDELDYLRYAVYEMIENFNQGTQELINEINKVGTERNNAIYRRQCVTAEKIKLVKDFMKLSAEVAKIKNRAQFAMRRSCVVSKELALCRQIVNKITRKLHGRRK